LRSGMTRSRSTPMVRPKPRHSTGPQRTVEGKQAGPSALDYHRQAGQASSELNHMICWGITTTPSVPAHGKAVLSESRRWLEILCQQDTINDHQNFAGSIANGYRVSEFRDRGFPSHKHARTLGRSGAAANPMTPWKIGKVMRRRLPREGPAVPRDRVRMVALDRLMACGQCGIANAHKGFLNSR